MTDLSYLHNSLASTIKQRELAEKRCAESTDRLNDLLLQRGKLEEANEYAKVVQRIPNGEATLKAIAVLQELSSSHSNKAETLQRDIQKKRRLGILLLHAVDDLKQDLMRDVSYDAEDDVSVISSN